MKILTYVFESFKLKSYLGVLGDLVVVKKPKTDVDYLCSLLFSNNYDLVLGVARNNWQSKLEPVAINNVHGHKIDKNGVEKLPLFVPSPIIFSVSSRTTRTFCNYTMYKVAKYLKDERLKTKFVFFHLRERDTEKMVSFIQKSF